MPPHQPPFSATIGKPPMTGSAPRPPVGTDLAKITPYFTLDAWRGVAALWVVMLHSCLPYIISGHRAFLKNPLYMVSIWGQLGVTIFFVISGYCITGAAYNSLRTQKPIADFCIDRVRRIYPPYLATLMTASILLGVTSFLQWYHLLPNYHSEQAHFTSSWAFWLTNLTLTQVPAGQPSLLVVAWSLCYEVCFYIVVAFFLGLSLLVKGRAPAHRLSVLLAGVGLLTCGSLAWLSVSPTTCMFPFKLWYQFGLGSLLFLGFAINTSLPGTFVYSLRNLGLLSTLTALLMTGLFAAMYPGQSDLSPTAVGHPSTRIQAIATIVFFLILYLLRKHDLHLLRNKGLAVLAHLGAFSYSLYLVHTPLLPYIDGGLRKVGFVENWYLFAFVSQILVATLSGWLFYLLIERKFISKRQIRRIVAE